MTLALWQQWNPSFIGKVREYPQIPLDSANKRAPRKRLSNTTGAAPGVHSLPGIMPHLLPCRVLLAEADERSASAARTLFEDLGYAVDLVVTGDDAVAQFARCRYGLVLLGLHMPVIDAFGTTARIRRLPNGPQTLIWTASTDPLQQEYLDAGVDDWLPKPYEQDSVQERLERWAHEPDRREERPWTRLTYQVQAGHRGAIEELYQHVTRWTRCYLSRAAGPGIAEDRVHDTYLAVLRKIQEGDLRDPKLLPPFVVGVVRNLLAAEAARRARHKETAWDETLDATVPTAGPNPEELLADSQRRQQLLALLDQISSRDREILTRFYLREQPRERICSEMGLTDTQFRLYKSRALARLGKIGQARDGP